MSSHREAPEISKDPVADNTDVYAFVSPDDDKTVTLIANFVPLQSPDGGPNFFAFGNDVLYEIHVYNNNDFKQDLSAANKVTYQFRFTESYANPDSFLYNTSTVTVASADGSAGAATYGNLNRRQVYSVHKVVNGGTPLLLGDNIPVPPCNVGIHSTPNYTQYVKPAIHSLGSDSTVFAGQRAEGFFADLGAVFDLGDLRPLQFLHTGPLAPAFAPDSLAGLNINTIAIKVPKSHLTTKGFVATDYKDPRATIGVYSSASRGMTRVYNATGTHTDSIGTPQQVSRLGNPLFNEVLIGIGQKDLFNATSPLTDSTRVDRVLMPELGKILPKLYPLAFRNLDYYNTQGLNHRDDLVAILLTGIPDGIIPGFQNNTGPTQADLLRLNIAIPVNKNPNILGVIAGDPQGFPNGRRLIDDIVTIDLRAILGATLPLTDTSTPKFVTDFAVNLVSDFAPPLGNGPFLPSFPYLGTPNSGFATQPKNHDTGS
jgi:hypothetical protein